MTTVRIDRAKWNSGKRLSYSVSLVGRNADRCCLGFLGKACGIEDIAMCCMAYPKNVPSTNWPAALQEMSPHIWMWGKDEKPLTWQTIFSVLNDYRSDGDPIDDATRESWVATGFKELFGFETEFYGEYKAAA